MSAGARRIAPRSAAGVSQFNSERISTRAAGPRRAVDQAAARNCRATKAHAMRDASGPCTSP
jgi:hypothetical protein